MKTIMTQRCWGSKIWIVMRIKRVKKGHGRGEREREGEKKRER